MKSTVFIICSFLFINISLLAQKHEPVTVKSGTYVKDYFPVSERYLYPNFTPGNGIFKNGKIIPLMFNFNLLTCEMEFLKSKDTLYIAKKEELDFIVVVKDTFFYHDAYLQKIRSGAINVFLKRRLEIKDIRKQGGLGQESRSSSIDSYNFLLYNNGKLSIDLKVSDDIIFQKTEEYFYSTSGNDYIQLNKKNIVKILPGREDDIKNYIKSNKVDFESREDLLKLADFVSNLLSENPEKK